MAENLTPENPQRRIRQLRDVSSQRPNDRDIYVYDKSDGKWVPKPGNFDEQYYPRNEADATFQPVGDYALATHDHDADYADIAHNHDADYANIAHDHDADYAPLDHNHDGVYSPEGHNHDGVYVQEDADTLSHNRLRAETNSVLSLTSGLHAFQIGLSDSFNLAMSTGNIQRRNNGEAAGLYLNQFGGGVYVNGIDASDEVATQGDLSGLAETASFNYGDLSTTHNVSTSLSTIISFQNGRVGWWMVTVTLDCWIDGAANAIIGRFRHGTNTEHGAIVVGGPAGTRATASNTFFVRTTATSQSFNVQVQSTSSDGSPKVVADQTRITALWIRP